MPTKAFEERFYGCLSKKCKILNTNLEDAIFVFDTSAFVLLDRELKNKCPDFLDTFYTQTNNIFIPRPVIDELVYHNGRGKSNPGIQKIRDDTLVYVCGITGTSSHKNLEKEIEAVYDEMCKIHFSICLLLPTIAKEYERRNVSHVAYRHKTIVGRFGDRKSLRTDIEVVFSAYLLKSVYPDRHVLLVTGDQHLLCTVHHLNEEGRFKKKYNGDEVKITVERVDIKTLDPNNPCHQNKCYFKFERDE